MADQTLNPACCSRNAVQTGPYSGQGTYQDIAGLKVYTTGPTDSSRAIVFVYDVFGLAPQTIQGADRLASLTDSLILLPDYFKGEPLALDIFPVDSDEKKARAQKFMEEKADFNKATEASLAIHKEASQKYANVKAWGAFGLCWGGKVTALLSGEDSVLKAAGTAHPGRLVTEEAQKMTIPYICLFSKEDGTPEQVEEYTKALQSNGNDNVIEKYEKMHHGWMGARAKLEDAENVKEYERGYDQAAVFFKKYL